MHIFDCKNTSFSEFGLKANKKELQGILHLKQNQHKYQLRRYFPTKALAPLIEQYWLVSWDLTDQPAHHQQNLPDPNCHLVIEPNKSYVQWVIRNKYDYLMRDKGQIIGVKFEVGALKSFVNKPMSKLVDQMLTPEEIFGATIKPVLDKVAALSQDQEIVAQLDQYFSQLNYSPTKSQQTVLQLLTMVKSNSNIVKVEQLAEQSGHSVRTIQRLMNDIIGLSPKWLIRKYRLHQALKDLEDNQCDIFAIVERLDYTDQAHLIRDFKEMIGTTPGAYLQSL